MHVYIDCPDGRNRPDILVPGEKTELPCRGHLSFYGSLVRENYNSVVYIARFVDADYVKLGKHPITDRPIIARDPSVGKIVIVNKYYSAFELADERPMTLALDTIQKRDLAVHDAGRLGISMKERAASIARLDEYNRELFDSLVELRKMTRTEWCV
jgi:hypothetical protein